MKYFTYNTFLAFFFLVLFFIFMALELDGKYVGATFYTFGLLSTILSSVLYFLQEKTTIPVAIKVFACINGVLFLLLFLSLSSFSNKSSQEPKTQKESGH